MRLPEQQNAIDPMAGEQDERRQAAWRKPPSPIRALITCGWLNEADARDSRLKVDTLSRSHVVVRVIAPDGRAAIVKHTTRAGAESGRNLQRELFVYRLAGWMKPLAGLLPRALLIDERRQLLVVEALSVGQTWPSYEEIMPIGSPGIGVQLACAMAGWHHATQHLALAPSLAEGILHLPDALDAAVENRSPSAQRFMRAVVADRHFVDALREARSIYRYQCLIHGDIRCDNWILDRRRAPPQLKLLDWEMCGAGDAAWDVASAFAESILAVIRDGASLPSDRSGWPTPIQPVLQAFLPAYASAGGLLDIEDSGVWTRLVLFTAARLLHVACEWSEDQVDTENPILSGVVAQARLLLSRRQSAAASLREWTA